MGRILNPQRGHISPQCHIVVDEHFSTVMSSRFGVWEIIKREPWMNVLLMKFLLLSLQQQLKLQSLREHHLNLLLDLTLHNLAATINRSTMTPMWRAATPDRRSVSTSSNMPLSKVLTGLRLFPNCVPPTPDLSSPTSPTSTMRMLEHKKTGLRLPSRPNALMRTIPHMSKP